MFDIIFYKYSGERNRLNKTLDNGTTISCNFNIEYNLINPRIKIVYGDDFDFNYCYIPSLNRYYFVDYKTITRNTFWELHLTIDVLMTYKTEILNLYGTVTQSTKYNYLQGVNIPVTSKTSFKTYEFNDVFNHDGTYVLITAGYLT